MKSVKGRPVNLAVGIILMPDGKNEFILLKVRRLNFYIELKPVTRALGFIEELIGTFWYIQMENNSLSSTQIIKNTVTSYFTKTRLLLLVDIKINFYFCLKVGVLRCAVVGIHNEIIPNNPSVYAANARPR